MIVVMCDVRHGDCLAVLRTLPDNSVDAVVTDPPYGLSNTDPKHVAETLTKWVTGNHEYTPPAKGGFMGRSWDSFVPPPAVWDECLRVLKPGGHMLVFAGSRTQDLMGLSIRLAGFELRDSLGWGHSMLAWCYGSGFPKSHNINKDKRFCQCLPGMRDPATEDAAKSAAEVLLSDLRGGGKEGAANLEDLHGVPVHIHPAESVPGGEEQDLLASVRDESDIGGEDGDTVPVQREGDSAVRNVRCGCDAAAGVEEAKREDLLLSQVQWTVEGGRVRQCGKARSCGVDCGVDCVGASQDVGGEQPCMEGRCHLQASEGELHRPEVCAVPRGCEVDGSKRWVHHGASSGDGSQDRADTAAVGGGAPHQPRPEGQQAGESGTVPVERGPQAWRGWPACSGCGKPALPAGLGTALKPAWEPIIMARKPLTGTVAANVLEWGTGALNIDASRVAASDKAKFPAGAVSETEAVYGGGGGMYANRPRPADSNPSGRWPANVLLDPEAAAAMDEQSGVSRSGVRAATTTDHRREGSYTPDRGNGQERGHTDSGGASRFFPVFKYQAKAPKKERPVIEREDGTKVQHPTVKPLALMEWLVTLVTPPGGVVLDPFAGSGTTLQAARDKGFRSIGIEADADHVALIRERLEQGSGEPDLFTCGSNR